jgi:putative ATP-dependent endonuclease of OLD family
MYLSWIRIQNFRCFGADDDGFEMTLNPGLTALVGENEAGKTAVVDSIRYALGTTDQDWIRVDDTDFHNEDATLEIRIVCRFDDLSVDDQGAFLEYLTYPDNGLGGPVLFIHWTAKDATSIVRGRSSRRVEVHSGKDGNGPTLSTEARELLWTTYLRPMRDAGQALASGRGSRLAQILRNIREVKDEGNEFDLNSPTADPEALSIVGVGDLANYLLKRQRAVSNARRKVNGVAQKLTLLGDDVISSITVSGESASRDTRLRQLLEKLEIAIDGKGNRGLGSQNVLFMACELLLLAEENTGPRMLLIEEPEAHLHPQRQLTVMEFLQREAEQDRLQVIVTTHSPNLASAIRLENLVMIRSRRGFSLAPGMTQLQASDYGFLERFLDVTKANLFFARGVIIVEGAAENLLIPVLAKLLGRDFKKHGVSIVNVGGTGLSRYARIFQRADDASLMTIPVACVTDLDVMPDCAPEILRKVEVGKAWPDKGRKRKWLAKRDFTDDELHGHRQELKSRASGQCVETFVSDEWTLEYCLALGPRGDDGSFGEGMAEEVYVAAALAERDEKVHGNTNLRAQIADEATREFAALRTEVKATNGCAAEETLATRVYKRFADGVSKAVAAQYLAEMLLATYNDKPEPLRSRLPHYLTAAIEHVTSESTGEVANREDD